MTIELGFDAYSYPGDKVMEDLIHTTPVRAVGAYLGTTVSHGGSAWMPAFSKLAGMGYTPFPIYVGAQSAGPGLRVSSPAQGSVHAHQAATLFEKTKLDLGIPVFLDIEDGPPLPAIQTAYITEWVTTVAHLGLKPGVYCSYEAVAQVLKAVEGIPVPMWAFYLKGRRVVETVLRGELPAIPTTTAGGYPGAAGWQYMQNVLWTPPGMEETLRVDFNVFDTTYPVLVKVPVVQTPAAASEAQPTG